MAKFVISVVDRSVAEFTLLPNSTSHALSINQAWHAS